MFFVQVQRIARVFDQLIEQQNERQKRKIETPRFTLKRVIDELEAFRNQLRTTPEQKYECLMNFHDNFSSSVRCFSPYRTNSTKSNVR